MSSAVQPHADGCVIAVHIQPRASRNEIVGRHDNAVRVRITAAPVEGAANAALVTLFSKALDVPKRDVMILTGQTGRHKRILVRGVECAVVRKVLDLA